jgi:hypothetical protein
MPANPHKGEVSFELVSGEAFTLQFTIDAVCTLEELLDKSSMEIFGLLARGRIGVMRAAMWAGLQAHHPKITLREAGEMIPLIKGDQKALQLVTRGLNLAFGEADQTGEAADDGKADPPEGGTGQVSSEAGAA